MSATEEESILRARIERLEAVNALMRNALWGVRLYMEHCLNMHKQLSQSDDGASVAASVETIGNVLKTSSTLSAFEEALSVSRDEPPKGSVYVAGSWRPAWSLTPKAHL